MTFEQCLLETANSPELLRQFCRLKGYQNPLTASGITKMVNEATGYDKMVIEDFTRFVFEYVYLPVFVWPWLEEKRSPTNVKELL